MHKIARNYAVGFGPRLIGSKFGYGLTEKEMRVRFFEEGFNTSRKTWTNFIGEWEFYGLISHDTENEAYWFAMNPALEAMARKEANRQGISVNCIVFGDRVVA